MWIPFEEISPESRVWIYQSNRRLTPAEQVVIRDTMEEFCGRWEAHGTPLRSSFKLDHDYFLILSVDEAWSGASGCSIDGSVKVIKALGQQLGVDFFGRLSAAFLSGDEVKIIPLKNIREALTNGILTPATGTFHTLAAAKKELETGWTVPLEKTWLAKYLPDNTLA